MTGQHVAVESRAGMLVSTSLRVDHALEIVKKMSRSPVPRASVSLPFACPSCQPFTVTVPCTLCPSVHPSKGAWARKEKRAQPSCRKDGAGSCGLGQIDKVINCRTGCVRPWAWSLFPSSSREGPEEDRKDSLLSEDYTNGRPWVCSLHSGSLSIHSFEGEMPLNLLSAPA